MNWTEIYQLHSDAAEHMAMTAEKIAPEKWLVPRASGKWTPAQTVEHLTRVYEVVTGEMEGGPGMKLRMTFPQRFILRMLFLGRILKGGYFPERAPAPYETRPASGTPDQRAAIAEFRERAAQYSAAAARAHDSGRRVLITHAYFGRASVDKATLLCARHIEHHERQLLSSRA